MSVSPAPVAADSSSVTTNIMPGANDRAFAIDQNIRGVQTLLSAGAIPVTPILLFPNSGPSSLSDLR
jgi:hypothetical protein